MSEVDVDTAALQNGTNAGDRLSTNENNLQGIEITNDGTKIFLSLNDASSSADANIKQYNFGTPYDLSYNNSCINCHSTSFGSQ